MPRQDIIENLFELLTGDDEIASGAGLEGDAQDAEPRNFLTHVASLAATKTGDGLLDPKLVLAWLLGALGAPAFMIGLLVPVRESLALLPQIFTAGTIRSLPQRKWVWAAGSAVQGIAVAAMAGAALTLDGWWAGAAIIALLAIMALARSLCSVSYKDVLGRTVAKTRRGTATGTAGTLAAVSTFAFGAALATGLIPLTIEAIAIALMVAGGLWLLAAFLFSTLGEPSRATKAEQSKIWQIQTLRDDPQLVLFIVVRGLLIATALAPPFLVALSGAASGGGDASEAQSLVGSLGPFVIAGATASIASSYVWGRFADRSSRKVLAASGLIAAVALTAAIALKTIFADVGSAADHAALPAIFLVLMIAYQGVRLGRSTHLVDMAKDDNRATYTALSNTIIGILLLIGSAFGVIASLFGVLTVLALFVVMCVAAGLLALRLEEVQA